VINDDGQPVPVFLDNSDDRRRHEGEKMRREFRHEIQKRNAEIRKNCKGC